MNIAIKLENITKSYNGITILNNINLEINKGQTVEIIGSNSSGKSVLFKVICGSILPYNEN